MRAVFFTAVTLALAACADEPGETPAEPASVEAPMPVEPDGGIGDGAVPLDEAQALANNEIPARFHGVWDYVEGTCALESDLRMEISAGEIMFYESFGKVTSVDEREHGVVVQMEMEGEGETWSESMLFSIGKWPPVNEALFISPPPEEGVFSRPMPRKRCPS